MLQLSPLTNGELAGAKALASRLFPWESEHQDALAAVADPSLHHGFVSARGLTRVRAVCLCGTGRVVGLASVYEYRAQPDEAWLAWFGLAPEVRGQGWGSKMLDWVIRQAREENKTVLRLWTTIEDEYATALQLYARRGFRPELQPTLPGENWQTVVLSLSLTGGTPPPWRSQANGTPLCGRVIRIAA